MAIPCEKLARNVSYFTNVYTTSFTEQYKGGLTSIEKEVSSA